MTTTNARQAGADAYYKVIDNMDYAVNSAGEVFQKVGNKWQLVKDVSADVKATLLTDEDFAKAAKAWGWTKNETGEFLDNSGNAISGFWNAWRDDNEVVRLLDKVGKGVGGLAKWIWGKGKDGVTGFGNGLDFLDKGLGAKKVEVTDELLINAGIDPKSVDKKDLEGYLVKNGNIIIRKKSTGDVLGTAKKEKVKTNPVKPIDSTPENATAIEVKFKGPDGKERTEVLTADKKALIRNFALNKWDQEKGFKLKVLKDNSTTLSDKYYVKSGTEYYRLQDANRRILGFDNTSLELSESAYAEALVSILLQDKSLDRIDPDFKAAVYADPAAVAVIKRRQAELHAQTISLTEQEHNPQQTEAETQGSDGGLNISYDSANGTGQFTLTAEQVKAVRDFVAMKPDTLGGYKLAVWTDNGDGLSPVYYKNNKANTALCRHGDASEQAMAFSTSTFKLRETQMYAALLAIAQKDAEKGYTDPYVQEALNDLSGASKANGWTLGGGKDKEKKETGPIVQGSDGRFYEVKDGKFMPVDNQNMQVVQGADGKLYHAQNGKLEQVKGQSKNQGQVVQGPDGNLYQMGQNGQMVPVQTGPQPVQEDNRNFFLSAGNWINNSLFGSIADLMPISLLKKAFQMIGNCIGGLFKAVGYAVEGEWSKAGSELFGWAKDLAITGGVAYGAYWLGKKSGLFGSDKEKSSSSSSSSSGNISDIINDALNNSNNSNSNSGSGNTTTGGTKVTQNENVYVSLNRQTYGEVAGTVKTITDPSGTTKRLLSTSDRFLTTGAIQDADSDGTVWRVQLDNRKNQK